MLEFTIDCGVQKIGEADELLARLRDSLITTRTSMTLMSGCLGDTTSLYRVEQSYAYRGEIIYAKGLEAF